MNTAARRIIFLDIDGVLNNRESMMRQTSLSVFSVSAECAARLRSVVDELDIKLVLSSTWRFRGDSRKQGLGFWRAKDALLDVGWSHAPFIGYTDDLVRQGLVRQRGDECNAWIEKNGRPGDRFVAVDDDGDFDRFVGTLVKTQHEPGLVDEDVEKIRLAFAA